MIRRTKYTIYKFSDLYAGSPDIVKSVIASNLSYTELVLAMQADLLDIKDYEIAILITREQEEAILESRRNDDKYEKRRERRDEPMGYIEGYTEMEHPEVIRDVDFGRLFLEDRKEKMEKLCTAFSKLTKTQQQRVYMNIVKEMSIAEIAQIEGKSWNSINDSLKSAYMKLRKNM